MRLSVGSAFRKLVWGKRGGRQRREGTWWRIRESDVEERRELVNISVIIIVCYAENSNTHTWHQQLVNHEGKREERREGEVGRESEVVERRERGIEKRGRDRGEMGRDGEYQTGK